MIFARLQGQYYCNILTRIIAPYCRTEYCNNTTPNTGNHINYLPTKDTFQYTNNRLSYSANTFFTSEEWTTSLQWTYISWSQCVLEKDVPLYNIMQCVIQARELEWLPISRVFENFPNQYF